MDAGLWVDAGVYEFTHVSGLCCIRQGHLANLDPNPKRIDPSMYQVFAVFDRAILLSAGRVIYSGPVGEVLRHFESLNFLTPRGINPAEYLLKVGKQEGWVRVTEGMECSRLG